MDWQNIKTEYIMGTSYRKLAQKYAVSYSALLDRGRREEWAALKAQFQPGPDPAAGAADGRQAIRAARLQTVADKLLGNVERLLEEVGPAEMGTQAMKQISGVLKDIKDIQMIKSEADMREQEAKIANLRRQAAQDSQDATRITVVMGEEVSGYGR